MSVAMTGEMGLVLILMSSQVSFWVFMVQSLYDCLIRILHRHLRKDILHKNAPFWNPLNDKNK